MFPTNWTIFLSVAGVLVAYALLDSYRRRNAIRQYAESRGFEYRKQANPDELGITAASFFLQGRRCLNVVHGPFSEPDFQHRVETEVTRWESYSGQETTLDFTYFDLFDGRRPHSETNIQSFVRFTVPGSIPWRSSIQWWRGQDEAGFSIEIIDDYVFLWREGKWCGSRAIDEFVLTAYSSCRRIR
jgi:hypothetical protein